MHISDVYVCRGEMPGGLKRACIFRQSTDAFALPKWPGIDQRQMSHCVQRNIGIVYQEIGSLCIVSTGYKNSEIKFPATRQKPFQSIFLSCLHYSDTCVIYSKTIYRLCHCPVLLEHGRMNNFQKPCHP